MRQTKSESKIYIKTLKRLFKMCYLDDERSLVINILKNNTDSFQENLTLFFTKTSEYYL